MKFDRKTVAVGLAALTLASSVAVTPAAAWCRWGCGAGIAGGIFAGALIGDAIAGPRYYAAPVYGGPCWRRVWGPYRWHWARVC